MDLDEFIEKKNHLLTALAIFLGLTGYLSTIETKLIERGVDFGPLQPTAIIYIISILIGCVIIKKIGETKNVSNSLALFQLSMFPLIFFIGLYIFKTYSTLIEFVIMATGLASAYIIPIRAYQELWKSKWHKSRINNFILLTICLISVFFTVWSIQNLKSTNLGFPLKEIVNGLMVGLLGSSLALLIPAGYNLITKKGTKNVSIGNYWSWEDGVKT